MEMMLFGFFFQDDISKEIPLSIEVVKYLGFMPQDLWESPLKFTKSQIFDHILLTEPRPGGVVLKKESKQHYPNLLRSCVGLNVNIPNKEKDSC